LYYFSALQQQQLFVEMMMAMMIVGIMPMLFCTL
jgi:hypothetical protein